MPQSLVTRAGSPVDDDALKAFTAGFDGKLVKPGDPGYEECRHVFNAMIDRRPGLIAQPAGTSDVQRCVNFAREQGLLISVNGGGHSVQGYGVCDGGLMVDLSLMKGIRVDQTAKTAVAEAGVNWGELDTATQQFGLAVTGGRVPTTGIAGLTLGSGSGWLERKLGYTVDNLISADVVTADGSFRHASESENADLFWGLRGGSGNFGIVTRFEYRLHPIGPIVFGGLLAFPRENGGAVLRAYRDFMQNAPNDVGGGLALMTAPPEPFVPEHVQGKPIIGIIVLYTGNPDDGERAFQPILDLGPVMKMVGPMPYAAVQEILAHGNPPGMQNYWKADMYQELPDAALDALLKAVANTLSPLTATFLQPLGGAVHDVPEDSTAMGWRSAKWALHVLGIWPDPSQNEANIAWVRDVAAAAKQWAQPGAYLNYLTDEGDQRIRDSFGANYQRMVELKNRFDPGNLFRLNQNIKPAG